MRCFDFSRHHIGVNGLLIGVLAAGLCLSSASVCAQTADPESAESAEPEPQSTDEQQLDGGQRQQGISVEPEVVPFSLQPYRVLISVSVPGSRGREIRRDAVVQGLRQELHRMYGPLWQLTMREADWNQPGTVRQIAELEVTDLIDEQDGENPLIRYSETDTDKVMLVSVDSTTAGFEVICREYDVRTQDLGPARRTSLPDARGVVTSAARLVRDSFRPYLKLMRRFEDDTGAAFMQLQVQGGEFVTPDPDAEQIREGDVLRLFQRFMKRTDPTQLKQLRAIPLTYVRVTSVDSSVTRGLATGAILKHGPVTPFGMRGRNLQQVALRQRPATDAGTVRLVARSLDSKPLICQRVTVAFKLRIRDSDTQEQMKLVSDRNGEVSIPVVEGHPTVWLYVYSGRLLLARVPYAPGLLPLDTITLPDDSIRLSVEGDLQLFRDDLVDAVALREVHFSMATRAAEEGRSDDVRQHLEDYDAVPQVESFRKSLSLIRGEAVNRAARQHNVRAQRAVERICRNMEETLDLFFSDEKLQARQEEIRTLRLKAGI